jgi:hypothetical protein
MTLRLIATAGVALTLGCLAGPIAVSAAAGPPPLEASHFDGRSPDTRDAANAAQRTRTVGAAGRASATAFDGRSPDTRDAAVLAHAASPATVVVTDATGFEWTDAAIGAVAGFGLATVLACGVALVRGRQVIAPS